MRWIQCLSLTAALILGACTEPASPAEPTPEMKAVAADGQQFAFDLYAHLASDKGNLFFSPYSISSALAMTYAGARNATADQMRHVLHFSLPDDRLHPAMAAVADGLNQPEGFFSKPPYELTVANAIWGQSGYSYNPQFIKLLRDDYNADLHQADFKSAPDAAAADINQWVSRKTHDKINNLISPDALRNAHEIARLVLVNAIYFKGKWAEEFAKAETKDQPFHLDGQPDIQAPLMFERIETSGFENDDLAAVELPYVGSDLSMVAILPHKIDGLTDLEQNLTAANVNHWLEQMQRRSVQVFFPKFKMEKQFELADVLSAMGMSDAFSRSADFSGITSAETIQISQVIHKAYVSVDEEGTEAAAATGVVVIHPTAVMVPPPPMIFRADHPFIFLIRQNSTGAILFLGRVTNPKT